MGRWVRGVVWLLAFWTLANDLWLWGGLGLTPVVGRQLAEQARMQSPLVATYLFLGKQLLPVAQLDDRAVAATASRFGREIAEAAEAPPETVVARFVSAQSAGERLDHVAAPLLLLLSLVLHARRQKRIRSFGVQG